MTTLEELRKLALSFPETTEVIHFGKISFRVNKIIFATWDDQVKKACVKLSLSDQDVFSSFDKENIYPVGGKWGLQGWTYIGLNPGREDLFQDALTTAYCEAAPRKLAQQVRPDETI